MHFFFKVLTTVRCALHVSLRSQGLASAAEALSDCVIYESFMSAEVWRSEDAQTCEAVGTVHGPPAGGD